MPNIFMDWCRSVTSTVKVEITIFRRSSVMIKISDEFKMKGKSKRFVLVTADNTNDNERRIKRIAESHNAATVSVIYSYRIKKRFIDLWISFNNEIDKKEFIIEIKTLNI